MAFQLDPQSRMLLADGRLPNCVQVNPSFSAPCGI
jgi:hypothetical protein